MAHDKFTDCDYCERIDNCKKSNLVYRIRTSTDLIDHYIPGLDSCPNTKPCDEKCDRCIHKPVCGKNITPGEFCTDFISLDAILERISLLHRLRIQCTKSAGYLFEEHPELLTIDVDDAAYYSYIRREYKDIKKERKNLLELMKEKGCSDD